MSAHLIGTHPTGSPEWTAARAFKMTGSRIAAAAGISPYESPFSLYYRMLGEIGEVEETPVMEWGSRLEPAVVQKYRDEHPMTDLETGGLWQNDARSWQVGTPDGVIHAGDGWHPGILEVKTARYPDDWGKEGTDEIPVHYRAQVLWYLDTLGFRWADIAVLITGSDYREYRVNYDEGEALELRRIGRAFLDRLETGQRPDIDGDSATYQAIKELHPEIHPEKIEVPDDLAHQLFDAVYDADEAGERLMLAKSTLADLMGDSHTAYWGETKIADRRAKSLGATPYMQLAPKISKHRKAS